MISEPHSMNSFTTQRESCAAYVCILWLSHTVRRGLERDTHRKLRGIQRQSSASSKTPNSDLYGVHSVLIIINKECFPIRRHNKLHTKTLFIRRTFPIRTDHFLDEPFFMVHTDTSHQKHETAVRLHSKDIRNTEESNNYLQVMMRQWVSLSMK